MSDEETRKRFIELMTAFGNTNHVLFETKVNGDFEFNTMESALQGFKLGLLEGKRLERAACADGVELLAREWTDDKEVLLDVADRIRARNLNNE